MELHAAHKKYTVTSSIVGAILGFDQYRSARGVWKEKVLGEKKDYNDFALGIMQHGIDYELLAAAYYCIENNIVNCEHPKSHGHPKLEWLAATPDIIVTDENGSLKIVEIKCPYYHRDSDFIDFKWILQLYCQMEVFNIHEGEIYVFQPDRSYKFPITFNRDFWDSYILPEISKFWCDVEAAKDANKPEIYLPKKASFVKKKALVKAFLRSTDFVSKNYRVVNRGKKLTVIANKKSFFI